MNSGATERFLSFIRVVGNFNIFFLMLYLVYWLVTRKRYNLPPGPRGFPILGYLPFLGKEPHKDFNRLSKQYGSIFGLYLGRVYTVHLSNYKEMKATLNLKPILGRPSNQFEFAPDGGGLSTKNEIEWKEQRRHVVRSMMDIGHGSSKWEIMIQEELDDVLKFIGKQNGNPLNYAKIISESISNNIMMLLFEKRFSLGDPARQLMDQIVELTVENMRTTLFRNVYPAIAKYLCRFGIGEQKMNKKEMKKLHKLFTEFSSFLNDEVEKRQLLMSEGAELYEFPFQFVDEYLKEIRHNISRSEKNFNERNLRGNILSLLAVGSDTTTASIMWLLIAMMNHPDIQEKVHMEVVTVLGKDGKAKYCDRARLPYSYAVTLECSRWATVVPLSVVRMALKDTKIGDYDIPKSTLIIPNLWSIHNSSEYWVQPEKFIPERFLTEDGYLLPENPDGFLPFSYGKRNCPCETVSNITVFQYFVGIMQKFKVMPPVGQYPNLEAKTGSTSRPVDQELRFVSRE